MSIFGTRIRVHPLFLAMMIVAAYAHVFWDTIVLFAVVLLHELGHILAAKRFGYRTESVELLPFGGVAQLSGPNLGWNSRHETIIAIWGPIMNLALVLGTTGLHLLGWVPDSAAEAFVTMNLMMLFFNLLPALPLDGGRIARAGLALSHGYEPATRVVIRMSFLLAILLMVLGSIALWAGYADVGLLVLGGFLAFSAYTVSRQSQYDTLRFLDAKRHDVQARAQPIRAMAVTGDLTIGEVAAQFAPGNYHLIYVHAQGSQPERRDALAHGGLVVEESRILAAIFEDGWWTEPIARLLL